jgi:ATP-dependent RNA helicase DDX24/MAK5
VAFGSLILHIQLVYFSGMNWIDHLFARDLCLASGVDPFLLEFRVGVSGVSDIPHHCSPALIDCSWIMWQISKRSHPHFGNLSRVQHLVVDEADRMIQQGSFPELARILEVVHLANPLDEASDNEFLDDADHEDEDRLLGLAGLRGEAKVKMLSADILNKIELHKQEGFVPEPLSEEGSLGCEIDTLSHDQDEHFTDKSDEEGSVSSPIVVRRTYVYSATLTLPASSQGFQKHRNFDVDGAIAEILEKARAHGRTKIVDLTATSDRPDLLSERRPENSSASRITRLPMPATSTVESVRLPPGLSLHHIKCTQKHKDSHLYAFLMTTEQGAKGPCLVFCNSIAAVRRVGETLATLRMEVRILHAQMQQVCLQCRVRVYLSAVIENF